MADIPSKLLSKIKVREDTGCWEWQKGKSGNGYGALWWNGVQEPAHRVFYGIYHEILINSIPLLRHTCDNKICVNPAHLVTGDHMLNGKDYVERYGSHKLTPDKVREIKSLLKEGVSLQSIADMYWVTKGCISHIKTGRSFRHIVLDDPLEKKDG